MSEIALDKGDFFPSPLTGWYRERPFKVALAGSLLIHAALLATVPGFRTVTIDPNPVLSVEIVEEIPPQPVVKVERHVPQPQPEIVPPPPVVQPPQPVVPERRVEQPTPEVVPPPMADVVPPPPLAEQPVDKPEPRVPVEPQPVQRPRLPEPVRAPDPVVRAQPKPDIPSPQAEIIRALPQPERQPDAVAVPRPDPRPIPSVEPSQEPRAEIRPEAPVPRVAPQQPPPVVQPRAEPVPVTPREQPQVAMPDAPSATAPAPPQPQPARTAAPQAERTLVISYEKSLSDLIRRHEKYPDRARRQGWEGTAVVGLALAPDGKVMEISILESSGRGILDDAALDMVRRASPLPRAPEGLRGKERLVRVPIVFKLHS